jgi:hypothetical protein
MSSSEVPLLTLEQVDELSTLVHSIQQENRKKLDETLTELVDISSANILGPFLNMQRFTGSSLKNGARNRR